MNGLKLIQYILMNYTGNDIVCLYVHYTLSYNIGTYSKLLI